MARKGSFLGAIGSFAAGYTQGLNMVRQQKMEDEKLALEKQRGELEKQRFEAENAKLKREEEMHQQLQRVNQDVKPTQMFVVNTPQGPMYQASEELAQAQAAELGTQVQPVFVVGTKTFADKQAANDAAEAMNLPAAQMRRRADVYAQYGREDLAGATMENYRRTLDNNRREIQTAFLDAQQKGPEAVMKLYNQNVKDGTHFVLTPDGQQVQVVRNGQVANTLPWNEQTQAQFMDMAYKRAMATPDNMLEVWKADRALGLQERQVAVQEKTGAAQVKHLDAQTADIPLAAQDRRTQAAASATSAGAAAAQAQTGQFNAITSRAQATAPVVSAVPGQTGGLNFVLMPRPQLNPRTGEWQTGGPAPTAQVTNVPGLRHPAAYTADVRSALPGLGTGVPGAAPLTLDMNAIGDALSKLPPRGAPQPGLPTSLSGVPGATGTATTTTDPRVLMTDEQRRLYGR